MKGAREYVQYLESGIFGRLQIIVGGHARGRTLHIYVLPEPGSLEASVEVYGVVKGQPGWDEEYGWLVDGPWVADFGKLVAGGKAREAEIEAAKQAAASAAFNAAFEARQKVLSGYVPLDDLRKKDETAMPPEPELTGAGVTVDVPVSDHTPPTSIDATNGVGEDKK